MGAIDTPTARLTFNYCARAHHDDFSSAASRSSQRNGPLLLSYDLEIAPHAVLLLTFVTIETRAVLACIAHSHSSVVASFSAIF